MRPPKLPLFWCAVGGTAIISQVLFNLAADRLGDKVPSLRTLNDYTTRKNG